VRKKLREPPLPEGPTIRLKHSWPTPPARPRLYRCCDAFTAHHAASKAARPKLP
jgi:hypothetical protein